MTNRQAANKLNVIKGKYKRYISESETEALGIAIKVLLIEKNENEISGKNVEKIMKPRER